MRQLAKVCVFALALVLASPAIVLALIEKHIWRGETIFIGLSQLLALLPGRSGAWMRSAFYFATLDDCSWEIHVGFGTIFTHRAASLARHVSMGAYCVIGHARIGEGVMMASRVSVPSGKRQHFDDSGRLTAQGRFETVTIGKGTWVGEAAVIMSNIGEHCVVSAGAIVTRDMPDRSIVGGNPAKVLKQLELAAHEESVPE